MGLIHNATQLWPRSNNTTIPVCWVTPGWEYEKQVIQSAVTRTWQNVTPVTFTDWGTYLGPTGGHVRLEIVEATDQQGGGQAKGTGMETLKTDGVSVSFSIKPNSTPLDRIRYLAVHEFGHVLGFQHEDDSPDREPGCTSLQPWANVTPIGPWDRHSIMNSQCNVYSNMIGYLSKGDVWSVRSLYGSRQIRNYGDFLGNGNCAWGVWRPFDGVWYIDDGMTTPRTWGQSGDTAVPGDYNGDGKTDRAVWRPSDGTWYIDDNVTIAKVWGEAGDIPVPADYNGDGKTDRAVWRPSNGTWYVDDGVTAPKAWGQAGDVPVPGDYDGDGKAEMAVWRPSTGEWFINTLNGALNVTFGQSGDLPVAADYLGEGHIRPVLFRPSSGEWIFWPELRPSYFHNAFFLGQSGDVPVPGSFSGNGIAEPAVWRPADGLFVFSTGWSHKWGQSGDTPLPHK
jgi:hypothetical protein